jgi:hypothetical protein
MMDKDLPQAIADLDQRLTILALEEGVDLDYLCLAASRAFDPHHTPGDPVSYTSDELWSFI